MIFPPFCFILHLYPTKQLFVMKAQDGGEGGGMGLKPIRGALCPKCIAIGVTPLDAYCICQTSDKVCLFLTVCD